MRLVLYLVFLILAVGTAVIATPLLITYYEHGIAGVAAFIAPGMPHNLTLYGGSRIFLPTGGRAGNQTASGTSSSMAEIVPVEAYFGGNNTLAEERILKTLAALSGVNIQVKISITGATLYMTVDNGKSLEDEVVPLNPSKLGVAGYVILVPGHKVKFVIRPGRPWVVLNFTFVKTAPKAVNITVGTAEVEGSLNNITSYAERIAESEFHGKLRSLSAWCDLRYVIKVKLRNYQSVIQEARKLLQIAVALPIAFGACTLATYAAYRRLLRPRVREG